MRHTYLFEFNQTNTLSRPFSATDRVLVIGFNMRPMEYTKKDDGTLDKVSECDYVTFERLLYDGVWDIDKCLEIYEQGVIASAPVHDECCKPVRIDHCCNSVWLNEPGIYRAVYHGEGRPDAAVIYYNESGK